MATPTTLTTSAVGVAVVFSPPPLHIDLPLKPAPPPAYVTLQEFLDSPIVEYRCRASRACLQLKHRLRILHNRVPQRQRTRLFLRKIHDPVDVVYHCFMEREEPMEPLFLLAARKRTHCGMTYFDFWADSDVYKLQQTDPSNIGYAQSNFFGTAFNMFAGPASDDNRDSLTTEIGTVMYKPELVAGKISNCLSMTVLLPEPASSSAEDLPWFKPARFREHLLSRWSRRREPGTTLSDLLVLENKTPLWNQDVGRYCLDDYVSPTSPTSIGTGTLEIVCGSPPPPVPIGPPPPSVKGVAVVAASNDERPIVLYLARVNAVTITIDLTYPLTAYTAACIAMTVIDGKGASNFIEFYPDRTLKHRLDDKVIGSIVAANL